MTDATLRNATIEGTDDVLTDERAVLRAADRALEHMRAAAERIADTGVDALASESLGRIRARRLAALAADPDAPAFFGRIDTVAGDNGPAETFHIGRRHVRDEHGDPIVVDWRAPVSVAFYRAGSDRPLGVRRRRRFGFAGRTLTSYEDERFDRPSAGGGGGAGVPSAAGVPSELLRREIERPRSGPMRDIVATISPEQDDLIRSDLSTSLCVQGAPGTGKTAVGLHRAAFLLYAHADRLRRSGVLVVGPHDAFLRYIEAVLPTLGETGVREATIDDVVGWRPAPDAAPVVDPPEVAVAKADLRVADALVRAVVRHVARPAEDLLVGGGAGARRYRVPAERLRRLVDDARREVVAGAVHWSVARRRIAVRIAEDVRRTREDAGAAPTDRETAAVSRRPEVREFLDTVWPVIDPARLLERFLHDDEFRRRCTPDLDHTTRDLLGGGPGGRRPGWSAADAVLLDELVGLVDGVETFGHVVVDEAQDLSPMQCRALARRVPTGSVTVLGDLAQATTPWAPGAWPLTLAALGHPEAHLRPLTLGYRVPGSVLRITNRLLPLLATGLSPAASLRDSPDALRVARAADLAAEVDAALTREGTVGVIVPAADLDRTSALLQRHRAAAGDRLEVVPAPLAKGLEFDTVVAVDPAAMVAAEPTRVVGLRRLYVVLTRAVSRLVVCVGADTVPELALPEPTP